VGTSEGRLRLRLRLLNELNVEYVQEVSFDQRLVIRK
jgi:hypothetical protein